MRGASRLMIVVEIGALVGLLLGLAWGTPRFLSGLIGVLIGSGLGFVGVLLARKSRLGRDTE